MSVRTTVFSKTHSKTASLTRQIKKRTKNKEEQKETENNVDSACTQTYSILFEFKKGIETTQSLYWYFVCFIRRHSSNRSQIKPSSGGLFHTYIFERTKSN